MSLSNGKSPSGDPADQTPSEFGLPNPEPAASKPERKKRKRRAPSAEAAKTAPEEPAEAQALPLVPADGSWTPWPLWLVPLPALLGLLALTALAWLGRQDQKATLEIPLDALAIELPAHLERQRFLQEVRYLGNLPERIAIENEDQLFHLKAALGKHPWVRSVESIERSSASRESPAGLVVKAAIRKPVLLVPVDPALSSGGNFRLVDEAGVLLPVWDQAAFAQLAVTVPAPAGPPGQLWGNPTVERAAALAGWFAHQDRPPALQIIKGSPDRWLLAIENRWVAWNEGPESITPAQMSAKLAYLRKLLATTAAGTPLNLANAPPPPPP